MITKGDYLNRWCRGWGRFRLREHGRLIVVAAAVGGTRVVSRSGSHRHG